MLGGGRVPLGEGGLLLRGAQHVELAQPLLGPPGHGQQQVLPVPGHALHGGVAELAAVVFQAEAKAIGCVFKVDADQAFGLGAGGIEEVQLQWAQGQRAAGSPGHAPVEQRLEQLGG
ncbi:hypothetical protein D3C76_346240 [compost metagenome]